MRPSAGPGSWSPEPGREGHEPGAERAGPVSTVAALARLRRGVIFFALTFGFCSGRITRGPMESAAALRELERRIEEARLGPRPGGAAPVPTGIPQLDALLPRGGLPRGRTVEWFGPRSCGKTAVLRATLERIYAAGEAVAVVDASRTLYAPDWAAFSREEPFWVVRPRRGEEAPWCADLLLRSGAFGAVALETMGSGTEGRGGGFGFLPRSVVVRLQRLAEDAGAVLVVLGEVPLAGLRLRFRPARMEPPADLPFGPSLPALRPVWVRIGEGPACEVPVPCPVPGDRSGRAPGRDRKGPP